MPTDGADFGRSKACYGKAFTALRNGREDWEVAEIMVRGVEREVKWEKAASVFVSAADLVVLATRQGAETGLRQLMGKVDELSRSHADSALTRDFLAAAEKTGLAAVLNGEMLSRNEAANRLLGMFMTSRCEGMSSYATKHRTHSIGETRTLLASVSQCAQSAPSFGDLVSRMLHPTPGGLPASAPRAQRIEHTVAALNSISLEEAW